MPSLDLPSINKFKKVQILSLSPSKHYFRVDFTGTNTFKQFSVLLAVNFFWKTSKFLYLQYFFSTIFLKIKRMLYTSSLFIIFANGFFEGVFGWHYSTSKIKIDKSFFQNKKNPRGQNEIRRGKFFCLF